MVRYLCLLCTLFFYAPFIYAQGIKMVLVQGGGFDMGSNNCENERPIHHVKLKSFYMGENEITQEQWVALMGYNPSEYGNCGKCPVETVSWNEIQDFIKKLNHLTRKHYRLPTEAEWEYVVMGGNLRGVKDNFNGDSLRAFYIRASYNGKLTPWQRDPHPVGEGILGPNALGIYDMVGNVEEFCNDWYDENYYKHSPSEDPQGPPTGKYKVYRGAYYPVNTFRYVRTYRNHDEFEALPDAVSHYVGFRLARDLQ